ncbi:chloramphenicol-sensitive protein RarD [Nocardioides thalensis]|uniref:Chloramphenicol-sensitive protein RarD n=1 Tax=Nocardioides thalensis TaxID=1914755 RepID=A0A853BUN0_9ACTN|nr:chloramphenicol-sensitive protein RarD [Nocardioides thalensis]
MSAKQDSSGLALGAAAYVMWGAFPLYFPLLEPSGAVEILAHRIVWSAVTMGLLLLVLRRTATLRTILADRRTTLLLVGAAVVITFNWGTYIYGVTTGRVVETSLGYFINPLVTVLMGVLILGERLRRLQWVALGIGFVACSVLTWDYGRPPYVALVLAFSFGTYGLLKKSAGAGAVESLALETAVLAPFALVYLLVLGSAGHFVDLGAGHTVLLMTTGLVTAVPLLCFGAAATRVTMTSLGLLQYLAPVIQFALGVTVLGEHMPAGRWIGFGLVWVALSIFTFEALRERRRRQLALVAEASAA